MKQFFCTKICLHCNWFELYVLNGEGEGGKRQKHPGFELMSHRSENYPWIVYDSRLVETEDRASDKR